MRCVLLTGVVLFVDGLRDPGPGARMVLCKQSALGHFPLENREVEQYFVETTSSVCLK